MTPGRDARKTSPSPRTEEDRASGWSYADAREFRLRMSLRATPLERLRDLEAMIDFNARVEANNPRVKRVVEALAGARPSRTRTE